MNIFAQFAQPVRSVADYQADDDNRALRREQLGAAQRTNVLADLTAQQTRQTMSDTQYSNDLIKAAYSRGSSADDVIKALRATGNRGAIELADKQETQALGRGKTEAETSKLRAEATAKVAEEKHTAATHLAQKIGMIFTPEDVAAYEDEGIAMGVFPPQSKGQALQKAQQLGGIEQWKQFSSQTAVPIVERFKADAEMARSKLQSDTSIKTTGMNNATSVQTTEMTNATTRAGQASVAATAAAGRGVQLQVAGMVDSRARDKNAIDQSAVGKVDWKQDTDGNWMALPKEVKTGDAVTPIATTAPGKRSVQAGHALDIITEARGLIGKSTGSYAGAAIDQAARVVGASTKGGEVAAKLKAMEGALMMAQPRMEGPQSNMDVLLYRQMAGQIGDSTLPAGNKIAALDAIEKLHTKYKNASPAGAVKPTAAAGDFTDAEKEARYQAWRAKQK